MTNTIDTFPSINTRIRDADGFIGTVAYVGTVASSKNPTEIYAGIVWDDHSRGKHDGSVICRRTNQFVRHFSCDGAMQGSFIRLRKLDFGVTLTKQLLRQKYVDMNAPIIAPNNVLSHTATTASGHEKSIEFLGELKIRRRQQLESIDKISLRREGISNVVDVVANEEEDDDMIDLQHIKEIDLAGNLFSDWDPILKVIKKFSNLESFSVAHNRIRDIAHVGIEDTRIATTHNSYIHHRFDKMKTLNLNNCSIRSFGTVALISKMMPNLESLCVANSNLSDINNFDNENIDSYNKDDEGGVLIFPKLKQLDCSRCGFDRWDGQVSNFAANLPLLESLSIDDNPIRCIPPTAGCLPHFTSLVSLQISKTSLSNWLDLEGINSFVSLKSLRINNIPLLENFGQGEVRSMSIARFPRIEYLNASRVSQKERIEAERRYVTLVTHSLQNCNNIVNEEGKNAILSSGNSIDIDEEKNRYNKADIMKQNPRYQELAVKHKNLVIFSSKNGRGAGNNGCGEILASSIYNITIRSMTASTCTMEPIVRRLPGTLNVLRLKALCSRMFDVDYELVSLRFIVGTTATANEVGNNGNKEDIDGHPPVEMDDESKTLDYYGLSDGDEILVDEIDVQAEAIDTKKNQEDLEKRMSEMDRWNKVMMEKQPERK